MVIKKNPAIISSMPAIFAAIPNDFCKTNFSRPKHGLRILEKEYYSRVVSGTRVKYCRPNKKTPFWSCACHSVHLTGLHKIAKNNNA